MECTYDELGFLKDSLIQNVQVEEMIGRGAYGRIMEAKWEGTVVAIKEIHSIFNDVGEEQFQALKIKFINECKQSSQLRHPNIVRFLGIYFPAGARVPSLVMERLHCSLTAKLLEQDPVISLEMKLSILHQISLGLRYLHTRTPPVIHRDLSSNNILISKGMEAKITDFGTVRILEPNQQTPMSLAPGTTAFMPPEALIIVPHQPVTYKEDMDIFSFGCVMLHTFSHTWPYPSQSIIVDPVNRELIPQSEIQRRDRYLKAVPKEVEEMIAPLIRRCLENHPGSRLNAEELCKQLEPLVINGKYQLAENKGSQSVEINDLQMQLIQSQTKVARKCAEIDDLQSQLEEKCAEVNNLLIQLIQSEDRVDRKTAEINSLQTRLALVNKVSSCAQVGNNNH